MQLPFRDYSLTAILAFVALTIVIVRGDTAWTLRQPWFIALLAVIAVSGGFDVWRKKKEADPDGYRRW